MWRPDDPPERRELILLQGLWKIFVDTGCLYSPDCSCKARDTTVETFTALYGLDWHKTVPDRIQYLKEN